MKKDLPEPKTLNSLDELEVLCRAPLQIDFTFNKQRLRVEARRLTPAEDARIHLILQEVRPKMVPGQRPGEFVPDPNDTDYTKRLSDARLRARAIALNLCIPLFKCERSNDITEFVQSKFTEDILQLFYNRVTSSGIPIEDQVNFT